MSYLQEDKLRSPDSNDIPFTLFAEAGLLVQIRHDTLLEFGKLTKKLHIVNNDTLANLTVRLHSPSGVLRTVPPNSDAVFSEWTSYTEINPNAVTGNFLAEYDMVLSKDAYQK